ncbi:MAG TPA: RDD family protein [Microbacteriaceae bacterium]|nr:RDD family protein [Microbacteriaceae bacterium]
MTATTEDFVDDLVTGEAVALDARPANFALRAAGGAIDFLVMAAVTIGGLLLAAMLGAALDLDTASMTALATVVLVLGVVAMPTLVETLSGGRSLGRLAVGARIVRDDGGAITLRHAAIRALVGVVEILMTFGGIAILTALLSTRTKRLGDHLAGTYSRHERVPRPVPLALPVPPRLVDWARTADVARLPDALSRRIAHYLRQSAGMQPASRVRLGAALAAEAAAYVAPRPVAPPDEFLVAVAALRRDREAVALARQDAVLTRLEPALRPPHGLPDRG